MEIRKVFVHGEDFTPDVKMHTTLEMNGSVPAFLAKLWKMVEDPKTNNLISWSSNGKSFFIRNQSKFQTELLPFYYKHNNMASFIRQLNMYGFHKKVSVELGGLKCDKDEVEFAHQYFCRDQPYLVENIKRKVASNKNQDTPHASIKPEVVNKMLAEVKIMKGRQENMNSTLNDMKIENATLWRELVMLRQKHLKQQQIINKLIQFLVTLVQPSRSGLSVKRRYPLMINDSSRLHKQRKLSKPEECPMGPIIHELDASEPDIDSDYIAEMLENETPTVQSPQERIEVPTDDENTETVQLNKDLPPNPKIETKKKHVCKGKKKQELHVFESINKDQPLLENEFIDSEPMPTLLNNESIDFKPIPKATLRSSKLAAMAANIKSQNVDNDINVDTSPELEDNIENLDNDASIVKLENILIVPEMLSDNNIQNNVESKEDSNPNKTNIKVTLNQIDGGRSVLMTNNKEQRNENRMVKSSQKENNCYDRTNSSSSQDLSVSRVNSSGMTEANYRLEPMEEMDNHLETMQNDLDNLREMLFNENCSINANTILELFETDPMKFGLTINPELNPDCGKEEDHIISDSANKSAGGELMAYNPSYNLLDFDADMFLGNASSSNPSDGQMSNYYTSDLDPEETKVSLLDDLVRNNANVQL